MIQRREIEYHLERFIGKLGEASNVPLPQVELRMPLFCAGDDAKVPFDDHDLGALGKIEGDSTGSGKVIMALIPGVSFEDARGLKFRDTLDRPAQIVGVDRFALAAMNVIRNRARG